MIDTTDATFEYARNWLVSSETFIRDAMLVDEVDLGAARDLARARIHREDSFAEPDEDEAHGASPDLPPPVDARPLALVITRSNERRRAGTGTWSGTGVFALAVEVLLPDEFRMNGADDSSQEKGAKYAAGKEWATRLCKTIRAECLAESGHSLDDRPYLNARRMDIILEPTEPERGEMTDYVAWMYEVEWI